MNSEPHPPGAPSAIRPDRRALGLEGEARAAAFLEARGYRIVARNVRADRVEIDLVARRGTLLVFVEVKTRRASAHGLAAEAVDARKQRRLRHGAHAWLATNPAEARGTRQRRFDVVTCLRLFQPTPPRASKVPVSERPDSGGPISQTPVAETPVAEPQNETTAPDGARWSFEHWEAAF